METLLECVCVFMWFVWTVLSFAHLDIYRCAHFCFVSVTFHIYCTGCYFVIFFSISVSLPVLDLL